MAENRLGMIFGTLLLSLTSFSWTVAEEIDAKEALRKMFETRDQLISGRCEIAGVSNNANHAPFRPRRFAEGWEDRFDLVFDHRISACLAEFGTESAYLRTGKYEYFAWDSRSAINQIAVGSSTPKLGGALKFEIHSLGFTVDPGKRFNRGIPGYQEFKDWFEHAEILETEEVDDHLRIKLKLPRSARREADIDTTLQVWLDRSRDFVTTRVEQLYPDRDGFHFRSEMLWDKEGDVWLMTHFRQFSRGRQVPEMLWKLTWSDVNKAIPESEFDLGQLPNPGRTAQFMGAVDDQELTRLGSVHSIKSNKPKPEGEPDWSTLPPLE